MIHMQFPGLIEWESGKLISAMVALCSPLEAVIIGHCWSIGDGLDTGGARITLKILSPFFRGPLVFILL